MRKRDYTYLGAGLFLMIAALLVLIVAQFAEGKNPLGLVRALGNLADVNTDTAYAVLSIATAVILAILGITVTVVAIVVELAATRYSHRITVQFVREPVNIVVLSIFVVTTVLCLWVSATLDDAIASAPLPRAGYASAIVLVSISTFVILPYFAFVFSFVSPLSMIEKMKNATTKVLKNVVAGQDVNAQIRIVALVDEIYDVTISAMEHRDRAIAMAGIDALKDSLTDYQRLRESLPDSWFEIETPIGGDPDFVSLESLALEEIQTERIWLEVKILRQYLLLLTSCLPRHRDLANLIAINTRSIAIHAVPRNMPLVRLCVRCFNSYLRSAINAGDSRTSYYVLNQYRITAEALLRSDDRSLVLEIVENFRYYGQLAFDAEQSFLLEVAAYDVMRLVEDSVTAAPELTDSLLQLLLQLDTEVRSEGQEASLIGVRRAQVQAATFFLMIGDSERARLVANDLRHETRERLHRIQRQLSTENRRQFWELTDRGVTFSYLAPDRRPFLAPFFAMVDQQSRPQ